MQLLEIKLTNWGPFIGDHTLQLSVDPSAPVVLFHGENMRGKTSLLRAIVWCLYGEIHGQDGRTPIAIERMVNIDAAQAGETIFGVTLKFSHNGAEFVLHRSGQAVEERPGKVVVSHLAADMIPVGGLPYPASNIPEIIHGVLAHDIADFFFDGEMLNRFEERLREEHATAQGFVGLKSNELSGSPS